MDMGGKFEMLLRMDPTNKSLRLAYAEWLEEQGRDDEATEQRRRAHSAEDENYDPDGIGCGKTCG